MKAKPIKVKTITTEIARSNYRFSFRGRIGLFTFPGEKGKTNYNWRFPLDASSLSDQFQTKNYGSEEKALEAYHKDTLKFFG